MATPVQIKVDAKTQEADAKLQKFFENFKRRAEETRGSSKQAAGATEELAGAATRLSPAAKLAAGGLALLVTAVASITKGVHDAVDAMSKLAFRANITVTEFSAASRVFERAGISANEFGNHLRSLSQKAAQADPVLKQLEVSAFRANGTWKSSVELLDEIADRFAEMPDGIEKTNLALKLFGESGDRMLLAMRGGAKGLREAKEEAISTGQAISKDLAEQVEKLDKRFSGAKDQLTAFKNVIESDALKLLNGLADAFLGAEERAAGFNAELITNLETVKRVVVAYKEVIRDLGLGGLIPTETVNTPFVGGLNKVRGIVDATAAPPQSKFEPPATLTPAEDLQFRLRQQRLALLRNEGDGGKDPVDKLQETIRIAQQTNDILAGPIAQLQKAQQSIEQAGFADENGVRATRAYAEATDALNKALEDQYENNKRIAESQEAIKKIQEDRARVERELEDAELARWQREQELADEWAQAEIERENAAVEAEDFAESQKFSNRAAQGMGEYVRQWTDGSAAINTAINTIDTALSGLADGITGLITGVLSWADAWRQTVVSIIAGIVQLIVKFTALWGIVSLLKFLFPGSVFVEKFAGFAGFAEGGYTGDVGERQPAGVVHGREYVLNASATRRIGLPALDAMNRGMALPRMGSLADAGGARGGGGGGAGGRQIMIHPVVDEESARKRIINHPDMEHFIVNVVGGAGFIQA